MNLLTPVHVMEATGGPSWLDGDQQPAPKRAEPMYRRRSGAGEEPMSEDRAMSATMRGLVDQHESKVLPDPVPVKAEGWTWAAFGLGTVLGLVAGASASALVILSTVVHR
jgi:hypothetical protein